MSWLPIQTKRLRIRRFAAVDVDTFCAYRADPDVGRYQGWNPLTLDEARDFVREHEHGNLDISGRWFQVAIAQRKSDAIIGDIGLCLVGMDEVEVGFSLATAAQGLGYGSEAVEAISRTLLSSAGIKNVRAVTDSRNVKSIAMLERLGFVFKRTCDEVFRGEVCQQHTFTLSYRA